MPSITCSDTNCRKNIEVAVGSSSAVCPHCNNFMFFDPVTADDTSSFNTMDSTPTSADPFYGYSPPPVFPTVGGTPSVSDPYGIGNEPPPPENPRKNSPPGYLISNRGNRYELKEGKNTIGRLNCDIIIEDKTVSRRHCVIEVSPKSNGEGWIFVIYDMGHLEGGSGSSNGVILSNRTIRISNHERIHIVKGVDIQLGAVHLKLDY